MRVLYKEIGSGADFGKRRHMSERGKSQKAPRCTMCGFRPGDEIHMRSGLDGLRGTVENRRSVCGHIAVWNQVALWETGYQVAELKAMRETPLPNIGIVLLSREV